MRLCLAESYLEAPRCYCSPLDSYEPFLCATFLVRQERTASPYIGSNTEGFVWNDCAIDSMLDGGWLKGWFTLDRETLSLSA
jgi:hypothetical protein